MDGGSLGATEQRRVEIFAELDIDEVVFPTGWAVCRDVLSAHKADGSEVSCAGSVR